MRPAPPIEVPAPLDGCVALLWYEDAAREVVARLKYRNNRASLAWLAKAMSDLVDPAGFHVVTWAPTTLARRRRRGFDQAELLARRVAAPYGLVCASLLVRVGDVAQTGRGRIDRQSGPLFRPQRDLSGLRVLLVDDVITTGSTVSAAARALRFAGASHVAALAAAHKPRGDDRNGGGGDQCAVHG